MESQRLPIRKLINVNYCSEECSNKGGTNGGSCASGFGVCCTCKLLSQKFTDYVGILFVITHFYKNSTEIFFHLEKKSQFNFMSHHAFYMMKWHPCLFMLIIMGHSGSVNKYSNSLSNATLSNAVLESTRISFSSRKIWATRFF